jgi:ABC-type sugar transport system ATPase subunit
MDQPLLSLRQIHRSFGRTYALKGVDFDFWPGKAHALLGENGSGKSTLMKVAYGEVTPDAGELVLDGSRVSFANPLQATRAGVTMVAQEVPVVPSLTVTENILLGVMPRERGVIQWGAAHRRAEAALAELGSAIAPRALVGSLNPSDRQVVAIARAVAAQARVVIFDEPTSSLTAERTEALFEIIQRMKSNGLAIAFISQRLQDIEPVADMVTVIRDGAAVRTLPIEEADEATVTRLMVGQSLGDYFHREVRTSPAPHDVAPVLSVRDLASGDALKGVSFDVRPGEVVGLAGLVGSGRVEIVRSIFGADRSTGDVTVAGRPHRRRTPRSSVAAGLALVTGDRKHEGLVGERSIMHNLTLVHNNKLSLAPVRSAHQRRGALAAMRELQVRPADPNVRAGGLSGGNQQKVVIGRWLAGSPKVFLLDEPTRGVDVGAKSEIYRVIRELAAQGVGVVISSSENVELLGLCDRVLMLLGGEIVADLPTDELDELTIAEHVAGVHHHV